MRYFQTFLFLSLLLVCWTSCGSTPKTTDKEPSLQTLWIGPAQADCMGVGPRKCLQVRQKETDAWENMFAPIKGFTYQAGYTYKVHVRVRELDNPPADASSLEYTLVKVLSKEASAASSDLVAVVYEAYTRGSFLRIEVTNKTVHVFKARDQAEPAARALRTQDWKLLQEQVNQLSLSTLSTLTPPSDQRASDRALSAQVTIRNAHGEFVSSIFDHKNPPQALQPLSEQVLALAEGLE